MQAVKNAIPIDDVLLRAERGVELTREEGLRLANCSDDELPLLLEAAETRSLPRLLL